MSMLIPFCVGHMRHSRGNRLMRKDSGFIRLTKKRVPMEKRLNSSGKISQDFRHCLFFLQKIQQDLERRNIQPEEFKDRIIFMSMRNTNVEDFVSNAEKVKNYAMRFSQGHWTFSGPGSEEKWYGSSSHARKGQWNCTAAKMVQRFKETGHLVFKSISALSRGILKEQRHKYHSFQRRFDEHRTLVPNTSFCTISSAVLSIRFDRRRKGKSQYSCQSLEP